jgi:putative hydrolase of the HAD superfamily
VTGAASTVVRVALDGVIFDWGGTLSVYADVDLLDMWRLAARHLDPSREDELTERLVALETEMWTITAQVERRSFRLRELLEAASADLGVDVTDAVLEEAAVRHLDAWTPHIRHHPDAADTLSELRRQGLRLGLLSNTHWPRAVHRRFLERDGLADLLHAEVYSCELPVVKPHPDAFAAALASIGIDDPTRAVFVGDRPYDDIYGAQQVGMKAVQIVSWAVPAYDVEPDARIHHLAELPALIERWR